MSIKRRQLLQWSSATLLGQLLRPSAVRASSTPKRVVFFHWPQGMVMPQFLPTESDLSPYILEPLSSFRSQLMMLSGIDNVLPDYNAVPTVHPNADLTLLTGTPFLTQDPTLLSPSGPSVEEIISRHISIHSPYPRIDLAIGGPNSASGMIHPTESSVFWHGPNDPVSSFNDPQMAALRIFGDPNLSPADRWAMRAQQSNVLDGVLQQFALLDQQLSSAQKDHVYPHWERLEQLENRIVNGGESCAPPTISPPEQYNYALDDHITAPLMNDIVVTALGCNYTNVATLHFANKNDHQFHWLWPRNNGQPIIDTQRFGNWHNMVHGEEQPEMALVYRWYMEVLADLLEKLQTSTDSDGAPLLDSTLVVALSEFSSGRHWFTNLPILLLGPVNGYQHVDYSVASWADYEAAQGRLRSGKNTVQFCRALLEFFNISSDDFGFRESSLDSSILDLL